MYNIIDLENGSYQNSSYHLSIKLISNNLHIMIIYILTINTLLKFLYLFNHSSITPKIQKNYFQPLQQYQLHQYQEQMRNLHQHFPVTSNTVGTRDLECLHLFTFKLIQLKFKLINVKFKLINVEFKLINVKFKLIYVKFKLIYVKFELIYVKFKLIYVKFKLIYVKFL